LLRLPVCHYRDLTNQIDSARLPKLLRDFLARRPAKRLAVIVS
jgi:hypothetical protein